MLTLLCLSTIEHVREYISAKMNLASNNHHSLWRMQLKGASVAKWLAHLVPFTSEAAGSNLTKYFLNAKGPQ
jgi:hypothetical protein